MQGAGHVTQPRVSRIWPWAEGGAKLLSHLGCPSDSFPTPCLIPPATEAWEVSWVVDWGGGGKGWGLEPSLPSCLGRPLGPSLLSFFPGPGWGRGGAPRAEPPLGP